MLVNTTINNKKNFSQFYTSYDLGMKMISLISNKDNITNVVDLSIGEGALIDSVIERYPQAKVFGIDIDIKNIKKLKISILKILIASKAIQQRNLLSINLKV